MSYFVVIITLKNTVYLHCLCINETSLLLCVLFSVITISLFNKSCSRRAERCNKTFRLCKIHWLSRNHTSYFKRSNKCVLTYEMFTGNCSRTYTSHTYSSPYKLHYISVSFLFLIFKGKCH